MAGILDKYESQSWKLAYYPPSGNQVSQRPNMELGINQDINNSALLDSFKVTGLDVENPSYASPGLAPPNNPSYTSKIGSDVLLVQQTAPYSPKNTYTDTLSAAGGATLAARASDLYK